MPTRAAAGARVRGLADRLRFAYAVLVIVTFSSAFHRYGLSPPALGLVYAGGLVALCIDTDNLLDNRVAVTLALGFPVLCLASALWSIDPAATLRYAVQFIVSAAIGAWMGAVLRPRMLFVVVAVALSLCIAASVANLALGFSDPYMQDDYVGAPRFFLGIYSQKNSMGAVIQLAALALVVLGTEAGPRGWLALPCVVALVPLMLLTGSTTATGLLLVVFTLPLAWWVFNARMPRRLVFGGIAVVVSLMFFGSVVLSASPVAFLLNLAGKEADLSGRTLIWRAAAERFADDPWFGTGYQAFWTAREYASNVDLVRATVLDSIANFHNAWFEVVVGTGLMGLVVFAAVVGILLAVSFVRLISHRPSPVDVGCFYLVLLVLIRSVVEASLYFQHQLDYLFTAALIGVLLAERRREAAKDARSGVTVPHMISSDTARTSWCTGMPT